MNISTTTLKTTTKIGVLLVHGIGEQLQFEHLEREARNIALALKESTLSSDPSQNVHIELKTLSSAAFGSHQETWQNGELPSLRVDVYDEHSLSQIFFHQVWWADLDEPITLNTEIRFWLWGLSLWTIKGKFDSSLPGYGRMAPPQNVNDGQTFLRFWDRVRLFWVALVILLVLPVLSLFNFVLRGLLAFNIPRPDILAQYIGDVKLFQQNNRIGKGPLQDLGLPPRVTIRRRTIRGIVEMALCPYDYWYILAHSQGTVAAFNGLMETAQSLPNYLTEELWQAAKDKALIRLAQGHESLSKEERAKMWPTFPSWRDKDYILDRKRLFQNLRGMLTYGSPLSKFSALWPAIVPLNQDSKVFNPDFKWFNVYDPTDPVAGKTPSFQPYPSSQPATPVPSNQDPDYIAAQPIDIAYKANRFHLLSHTEYLTYNKDNPDRPVNKVVDWLLKGTLLADSENSSGWLTSTSTQTFKMLRIAFWVFLALLIGGILSELVAMVIPKLSSYLVTITGFILSFMPEWLKWTITAIYLSGISAMLGSLVGGVRFLIIGGFASSLLITLLAAAFPMTYQLAILNWTLHALVGGIAYILLGAIAVLAVGTMVRLMIKDPGNL